MNEEERQRRLEESERNNKELIDSIENVGRSERWEKFFKWCFILSVIIAAGLIWRTLQ